MSEINLPNSEQLILVDEKDQPVGACEKMEAHTKGYLHRAFSVFLFDNQGQMLLQRRALNKYHSGGLWTNACCSHPYPGEETLAAALRRLQEEMGFVTPVTKAFDFVYKAQFENGLTEYEFDHVFVGAYEGPIQPNPEEVMDYEYVPVAKIEEQLLAEPDRYTAWFRIAFPKLLRHIINK